MFRNDQFIKKLIYRHSVGDWGSSELLIASRCSSLVGVFFCSLISIVGISGYYLLKGSCFFSIRMLFISLYHPPEIFKLLVLVWFWFSCCGPCRLFLFFLARYDEAAVCSEVIVACRCLATLGESVDFVFWLKWMVQHKFYLWLVCYLFFFWQIWLIALQVSICSQKSQVEPGSNPRPRTAEDNLLNTELSNRVSFWLAFVTIHFFLILRLTLMWLFCSRVICCLNDLRKDQNYLFNLKKLSFVATEKFWGLRVGCRDMLGWVLIYCRLSSALFSGSVFVFNDIFLCFSDCVWIRWYVGL